MNENRKYHNLIKRHGVIQVCEELYPYSVKEKITQTGLISLNIQEERKKAKAEAVNKIDAKLKITMKFTHTNFGYCIECSKYWEDGHDKKCRVSMLERFYTWLDKLKQSLEETK